MVQIIRRTPHKSTSDYVADALRAYGEGQGQKEKREREKEGLAESDKALSDSGIKVPKGLKGKDRDLYISSAIKHKFKQEEQNDLLSSITGNKGQNNQQPQQQLGNGDENVPWYERKDPKSGKSWQDEEIGAEQQEPQPFEQREQQIQQEMQQGTFDPRSLTDEDLIKINVKNPAVGRQLQAARDSAYKKESDQTKATAKRASDNRKETLPIRKEFADQAKYAREGIANKKLALNLLAKGKVDDPLVVHLAEKYLPGAVAGKVLSGDTALYKSGLFEEFGVLRNMFPGAIRVKEIELLEDKLATLDKSPEAKEQILTTGMKKLERPIILADAARQVEKENPDAGLLEFEEKVFEKAQPKLDVLYEELTQAYNEIYFKHAPAKSTYVDQNGKQYYDVPKKELKTLFDDAKTRGLDLRVK